jgi:hypothetical protein
MARTRKKTTAPRPAARSAAVGAGTQRLTRDLMEQLMFGGGRTRRFTQDSPVLPDVWLEYARQQGDGQSFPPVKLLLTPYRDTTAGDVRTVLRERLAAERKTAAWRAFGHDAAVVPRVVYNQSTVATTLYFEDLVRAVFPLTEWWRRNSSRWGLNQLQQPAAQRRLAEALRDPEHPRMSAGPNGARRRLPADVLWLVRVVGALALVRKGQALPPVFTDPNGGVERATADHWLPLVRVVAELLEGLTPVAGRAAKARVYVVSLNREATLTVSRSALAVKADAARRLFEISCRNLAWAIVDSGIDARHPAFQDGAAARTKRNGAGLARSRVRATYDFTQIDVLLDPDTADQPKKLEKRMKGNARKAKELEAQIAELNNALNSGRAIDWALIAPLLEIPHDDGYVAPQNDHGTHVAGILAANWKQKDSDNQLEEDLKGVCPDLRLYDLRVLNDEGRGDEFAVMAALQFVRHLNASNDYVVVHGVNLSLSIRHDVANYACGRTPVCDECERVVNSGVVVVAAAGNQGYRKYTSADGVTTEAYNTISITDPGNADLVLTVGATHRFRPHTYGVSYFSSRGPTGDGRIKPDLVAPGEKISAPLPDRGFGLKDGTSMAAPHVSGAAALLMARHSELVGRPQRIKQILCQTAIDLGRERYFQGAGMLDVLRALQSV